MDPQVLGPILGVDDVRGGHSELLLRQARDAYCGAQRDGQQIDQRFFHFYLPGKGEPQVPLNWLLSDAVAERIWGSTTDPKWGTDNLDELKCLRAVLNQWTRNPQGEAICASPPAEQWLLPPKPHHRFFDLF